MPASSTSSSSLAAPADVLAILEQAVARSIASTGPGFVEVGLNARQAAGLKALHGVLVERRAKFADGSSVHPDFKNSAVRWILEQFAPVDLKPQPVIPQAVPGSAIPLHEMTSKTLLERGIDPQTLKPLVKKHPLDGNDSLVALQKRQEDDARSKASNAKSKLAK